MKLQRWIVFSTLSVSLLAGCNRSDPPAEAIDEPSSSISMDAPPPATVETHAHPSEGPHHGTLIELGKEDFHAELVHDDKSVTIYVLDGAAENAVPIDAKEVAINLLHEGKPMQFKLAAAPDVDDPSGKSSRFVSNDAELVSHLDDESAAPKLSMSIEGKAYRGSIRHDHDH